MARTRAPCTSQNTPRMHCLLRQARRVGGDHKRKTLCCSTAVLVGDSGLTSAELLAAEVQYRALALCPRTEPDRARVRVRGEPQKSVRTYDVGALRPEGGLCGATFRALQPSSWIFDGDSNHTPVRQLRLAAHVHTRRGRGLPEGSAVCASRKDGLQAQAPERPGCVLLTGGKILLYAGARCAQPPAPPRAAPFSGLTPLPGSLRRRCRATRWSHSSRCPSSSPRRRSRRTARWAR